MRNLPQPGRKKGDNTQYDINSIFDVMLLYSVISDLEQVSLYRYDAEVTIPLRTMLWIGKREPSVI